MATRVISDRSDRNDLWSSDEREMRTVKVAKVEQPLPASPDELFLAVPDQLISRYVQIVVRRASTEELEEGGWFAESPRLRGVYGEGSTEDEALQSLASAVTEWVTLKRARRHGDIPVLEDIDLNRG